MLPRKTKTPKHQPGRAQLPQAKDFRRKVGKIAPRIETLKERLDTDLDINMPQEEAETLCCLLEPD